MASADEIPPHHDVLGKGLSAEHDHATAVLAADAEVWSVGTKIEQLVDSDCRRFHDHRTRDHKDSVLKPFLDSKHHIGTGIESQVRATERRVGQCRRPSAVDVTNQHLPMDPRPVQIRQIGVALERRVKVAHRIRQRDPKLYPMQQRWLVWLGNLAVHDAVTRSHDVELPRPYHRPRAETVAMLDLAVKQPADRLQAGVRMRPDLHAG